MYDCVWLKLLVFSFFWALKHCASSYLFSFQASVRYEAALLNLSFKVDFGLGFPVDDSNEGRFGTGEAPAFAFMVGFQPHGGSNQEIQP